MKYRYPDYFDEFKCIAGDCPCTCCSGWAIEIDEDSLEKYRKLNVKTVDYDEEIFMHDGSSCKRCLNLNHDGLCDLIIQHGEEILCDTCRLFPRHIEEFEGVRELSLSISCPEVAHMLLNKTNKVSFIDAEDELADEEEYDEYEQSVFQALRPLRDEMLEILQDDALLMSERCRRILQKASAFQDEADGIESGPAEGESVEEFFSVMEDWEYTSDVFPELLAKAKTALEAGEKRGEDPLALCDLRPQISKAIVSYFIYAYFCGSAYDEYYYGMAQLAVGAAIHINQLCQAHERLFGALEMPDIERYTYLYAREQEHSIPNVLATEAWMDEKRLKI